MIINDLYPLALVEPTKFANKLFIVSGYASATFARRHIVSLLERTADFEINLIIGMPNAKSDHMAFVALHNDFKNFKGYYYKSNCPVHCKVYSWYNDDTPYIGYSGSANYSQYGFFKHLQINQLNEDDPTEIKELYDTFLQSSIFIPDHQIILPESHVLATFAGSVLPGTIFWEIPDVRVTISFLAGDGHLPQVSGLNWGQRLSKSTNKITGNVKWNKREPNQAYLGLRLDSRKEGFLPELAYSFSLITDDGYAFDCVVAQDGRKAIHSTNDNSEIGKYIRNRIGVPLGSAVTVSDLERYGRTDYTIEKIDEETFLLDFSV
ncbi:restriction endonuclease PLD domain-containing protein [Flavobacterium sp.]|uniref:restriction endonuclease PLD domain-containing protein n=1 Tax=Flavobacterium sp. TaxID=239 RepID=UPI0026066FE6|nr:restriction endonuclease PLD domain-containing protein [Flavobacterium sp.]